jgi:hypothetical protein
MGASSQTAVPQFFVVGAPSKVVSHNHAMAHGEMQRFGPTEITVHT